MHGFYLLDYTVLACRQNKINGQGDLFLTGLQRHWTKPSVDTPEGTCFAICSIAPPWQSGYFNSVGNLKPTKGNKPEEHNPASCSYVTTIFLSTMHTWLDFDRSDPISNCINYVPIPGQILDKSTQRTQVCQCCLWFWVTTCGSWIICRWN